MIEYLFFVCFVVFVSVIYYASHIFLFIFVFIYLHFFVCFVHIYFSLLCRLVTNKLTDSFEILQESCTMKRSVQI